MPHPPHLYLNNTWYIFTGSTYQRHHLFKKANYKDIIRDQLKSLVIEFNLQLTAWVILDNHYHILIKSQLGSALPQFFGQLHGRTSFEINGLDKTRGRQVWRNYWDTCIGVDSDYWTRFNYIHHNPIKHGYVTRIEDWPYSSYHFYLEHKGADWLADTFRQYPIIDFTDPKDGF